MASTTLTLLPSNEPATNLVLASASAGVCTCFCWIAWMSLISSGDGPAAGAAAGAAAWGLLVDPLALTLLGISTLVGGLVVVRRAELAKAGDELATLDALEEGRADPTRDRVAAGLRAPVGGEDGDPLGRGRVEGPDDGLPSVPDACVDQDDVRMLAAVRLRGRRGRRPGD